MDDGHSGMEGVSAPGGNREQRRRASRRSKRMVAVGSGAVLVAGVAGPGGLLTASVASAETFTVDSLADDGTGTTLREAIEAANAAAGEDTITFAAGLSGTIVLASDLPLITESVSILGPGAGVLAVDGDGNSIFQLDGIGSGTSTISGLTLTGAYAEMGGAIGFYSDGGSLAVADAVITGNEAGDEGGGIGVDTYEGGFAPLVTITNTTISGNTANSGGGGVYFDANDASDSTLTVTGSLITGNEAAGGEGGGLYTEDVSVEVFSSTISDNTADGGGGGVYTDRGDVIVEFSTISGNTAVGDSGGGGMYFSGSESYGLTIRNSTLSGNSATDYGGALYMDEGTAVIENSTISGNTAYNAGGIWSYGYLTLIQSTVTDNTATGEATQVGGIQLGGGSGAPASAAATKGKDKAKDGEGVNRAAAAGSGEVDLIGTIVAGNAGQDIGSYETPSVTANSDHSIIGVVDDTVTVDDLGGTQLGVTDPGLAALAANGGPTQTHALLDGSPALNAGPVPVPSFPGNEYDQRGPGYARVAFGVVDVGAFEAQEDEPVVPPTTAPEAAPAEATVVTPTFTG